MAKHLHYKLLFPLCCNAIATYQNAIYSLKIYRTQNIYMRIYIPCSPLFTRSVILRLLFLPEVEKLKVTIILRLVDNVQMAVTDSMKEIVHISVCDDS